MSLLKEIKHRKPDAVSALEKAGFHTDSEIQSLTREDLRELFPGLSNLKLRKSVFEIIHKQKPIDALLRELKEFIPHDSLRDALNSNGVLVDYLHILKEMKTQTANVQKFLEAHIGLLEEFSRNQHQEPDKGTDISKAHNQTTRQPNSSGAQGSLAGTSTSGSSGRMVSCGCQTEDLPPGAQGYSAGPGQSMVCTDQQNPQGAQYFPCVSKVMYQKVVSGKNFGTDTQLLAKVKAKVPDQVQLIESDKDSSKIIIVFCTISSRVGTDVEAAMSEVKGDKPVILVLMYHTREAKNTVPTRTLSTYPQVVLQVNVFFHETMPGLLECKQNHDAVCNIKNKLLEYRGSTGRKDSSENALSGGDGVIGLATHRVAPPPAIHRGATPPATGSSHSTVNVLWSRIWQ